MTFSCSVPRMRLAVYSTPSSLKIVHSLATPWRVDPAANFTMASRRSARLTARAEAKPVESSLATATMPPPTAPAVKSRKRKASPSPPPSLGVEDADIPAPSTPKRRARKTEIPVPPPATPTPSAVHLMAEAANGVDTPVASRTPSLSTTSSPRKVPKTTPKPKSRAVTWLADPNATNAPLLSPETSRVIARTPALSDTTPSRPQAVTTANILEAACAHLTSTEPRLAPLVAAHHCRIFAPEGLAEKIDPFESLVSGILSQQVSGAAAKAIKARFIALFDPAASADATTTTETKKFPTPSQIVAVPIEKLRTAGLSQRKAEYIHGLAQKFNSGELTASWLAEAPYEEVLEKLIAVRGLGRWSVEMFACFGLKRMDVFSTGDLGVQRGMAAFAGRDVSKLKSKGGGNKWKYMSEQEMLDMAAPFSPYRSVFMWYMWRVEETDVSTLE